MSNPVSRKRKELVIEHRAKKRLGWYMEGLVWGMLFDGYVTFYEPRLRHESDLSCYRAKDPRYSINNIMRVLYGSYLM